ncbi:MAG TPA: ABC transporter ATP-binding protein [Flavobacteriales bacterium]|nr:ABC transporter ATP-binding protein [Flavobacteriales bacterium]HMR28151.1 ABC transporter ATP-binding protein [Flavobacteriales bacterium]
MSLLSTRNLSKIYRTDTVETTALHDVSIEIDQGEFVAIMGPSGCGKSTLLNIIGLLDPPSSGSYLVNGEDVSGYNERRRAEVRKSTIGFVFQSFNLIDELTVDENIELPLVYTRMGKAERRQRVQQAMDRMNIAHRAKHFPQQLSGGQQQRVAIARAVVNSPRLILADEPTGNLDSAMGEEVMGLLTELNKAGTTVIIVTHSLRDAGYAQRTIKLLDGKVVAGNVPAQALL